MISRPHTAFSSVTETAPWGDKRHTAGNNGDGTDSNDCLLLQLQQRLYHLGIPVDEKTANGSLRTISATEIANDRKALNALIAALYQAQQYGQGVLSLRELSRQGVDVKHLQTRFPKLFSRVERPPSAQSSSHTDNADNADNADDSDNGYNRQDAASHAPLVYFPPFTAFRRDYRQLQETAAYLQRPRALHTPSPAACQKITWQLGNGAMLSDEQRLAAVTAATLGFCLITGGAGTGKTTTLVKALELILLDNPHTRIVLAAPTGKAAHRLNESLTAQHDSVHKEVRTAITALRAQTIHRLLGIGEHSGSAFYHAANPLRCDVLVIDEASMTGSDLLASIRQAVLPATRLILLGDANQLSAINSTAFFNDISRLPVGYTRAFCQAVNPLLAAPLSVEPLSPDTPEVPLPNAICQLSLSRRFAEQSLIECVANRILAHDSPGLFDALQSQFVSLHQDDYLAQLATAYPSTPTALQTALQQRMILCANRRGIFGSERVNAYLDRHCRRVFRNTPEQYAEHAEYSKNETGQLRSQSAWSENGWYEERRIIIEQNDYRLGIYNGDIGVCRWLHNQWMIRFDDERLIRVCDLNDEKYSLAFAISVHKSQGSEYEHVDVVLDLFDAEHPNPLINRPLLYTAVTRAKSSLALYADKALVTAALQASTPSLSPLQYLLTDTIAPKNNTRPEK